jgi:hypothetical protein
MTEMITTMQLHTMQMVFNAIKPLRLNITNEKKTQSQIFEAISHYSFVREYKLDEKNIPDFFYDGIAVEVKIKGSKKNIYLQLKRYCEFDQVKAIILVTGRSMGLPSEINGKPCFYINLTRAYL